MAVIKLINYDQLYTTLESVKAYVDNTVKKYLPLSGGTITGDLYVNKYLGIKAYTNYGSGTVKMWFNGTNSALSILGANNIVIGNNENTVLHTGNYDKHALPLSGGTLTGRLSINKNGNTGYFEVGSNDVHIHNTNANIALNITNDKLLKFGSNIVLDASNYSSYAMPLSGGSFTGSITLPNNKYINGTTPEGASKSILGITTSNNCVIGSQASQAVIRSNDNPIVKIPVDGKDTDYTLYHSGNHVFKQHGGETTSKDDPLGTMYFKMYDNTNGPKNSHVGRVTCSYSSDNKSDYTSLALYDLTITNDEGKVVGGSANYINLYPDHAYTKKHYKSGESYIILGGHRLTIASSSSEPSTKTKGDIWIQI